MARKRNQSELETFIAGLFVLTVIGVWSWLKSDTTGFSSFLLYSITSILILCAIVTVLVFCIVKYKTDKKTRGYNGYLDRLSKYNTRKKNKNIPTQNPSPIHKQPLPPPYTNRTLSRNQDNIYFNNAKNQSLSDNDTSLERLSLSEENIDLPYPSLVNDSLNTDAGHSSVRRFKKRLFLSKCESFFYSHLKEATPVYLTIQCKVGLWAIVEHINDTDWNRISQKQLDFVIYDENSNNVLLVIELDDSSHFRVSVKKKDAAKNEILAEANIPILRIKASNYYDIDKLRTDIKSLIKR